MRRSQDLRFEIIELLHAATWRYKSAPQRPGTMNVEWPISL
jgi:hypothetical protein